MHPEPGAQHNLPMLSNSARQAQLFREGPLASPEEPDGSMLGHSHMPTALPAQAGPSPPLHFLFPCQGGAGTGSPSHAAGL